MPTFRGAVPAEVRRCGRPAQTVTAGVAAVALAHVRAAALQLDATARVLLFAAAGLLAVAAFTAARARSAGREPEPEVVAQ